MGSTACKEQIYGAGNARAFALRGVSTLLIDQPGTGEALRLRGLIGIFGLSLGGYFAPRATTSPTG